ncbi:MAG: hypothetical protein HRF50_03190 [Phycisphaerae bacterium]|jgi:uncharacterized protein (UPF0179 family)
MTSDKLREAVRAQPFRPFRVHLGGGRALDVTHPDFMMISPSGRTAAVSERNDEFEIIDVLMVPSIEFCNGRTGRRRRAA